MQMKERKSIFSFSFVRGHTNRCSDNTMKRLGKNFHGLLAEKSDFAIRIRRMTSLKEN
jgi:hypothetical protein